MPFIVDPGKTIFTPQPSAVSADGRLKIIADPSFGGVLVVADFTGLNPIPSRVGFTRDGGPVRSGFFRLSPGGQAVAYDHLASFNQYHTWRAVGFAESGQVTSTLEPASLTLQKLPALRGDGWLKSLSEPSLSQPIRIYDRADGNVARSVTGRSALEAAADSAYVSGSWSRGVPGARQYEFKTVSLEEANAMWDLLQSGTLLFQAQPEFGIPDYFCVAGDIAETPLIRLRDPQRVFNVQLTPIEEPPHLDAPLLIPGRSWGAMNASNINWSAVSQARSWGSLLGIDVQ